MKKTVKKILALSLILALTLGLATAAMAGDGKTVYLTSAMGELKNTISISNFLQEGGDKYDFEYTTLVCKAPVEIVTEGITSTFYVVRLKQVSEKMWEFDEYLPVDGKMTFYDFDSEKELTINYNDMDQYEMYEPPEIHKGATAKITENGVYYLYADRAPIADFFEAVIIVEGGSTKPAPAPAPATAQAKPTASQVLVNGKAVAFDAYNINDNNYFKLRDIAYILNGTGKQFSVDWDGEKNAISLTTGKPYTPNGSEMTSKGAGVKNATLSTAKVILNGQEVALTAYNIEGNNYFKLRDLGYFINFGVDWDGQNVLIYSETDYIK